MGTVPLFSWPISIENRSRLPPPCSARSKRQTAPGFSVSVTRHSNAVRSSHAVTMQSVSQSKTSGMELRPRNVEPTPGSSSEVHSAPWNSSENCAGMLMSVMTSHTARGRASVSISATTPCPSATRAVPSSLGRWRVKPHWSK